MLQSTESTVIKMPKHTSRAHGGEPKRAEKFIAGVESASDQYTKEERVYTLLLRPCLTWSVFGR